MSILAVNMFVYASIFDEPEAETEINLCRGFKPKGHGHLTFNLIDTEFVECCVPSKTRHWCDFLSESPLCEEHLKHRTKNICITGFIDGASDEEGMVEGSDYEQEF